MKRKDEPRDGWDLDLVMPELPAQGRWRGGPVTRRLGNGPEEVIWHPGDGDRVIRLGDGVATLRLEDTDLTLAQILAAITPEPRAPAPRPGLGEIDVTGTTGLLRIGSESIGFEGLRRIVIGGFSRYPARP
jgi:hypothetical protein